MPIGFNTPRFGAYFQCHKNPLATYKVLESFRKFYPSNTIVLVSDNGYNYEGMAEKFNCTYGHCNENLVYIHRKMDDGSHIQHGMKLMKRICDALLYIKEEYFMWLEDDVIINQKVIDNFRYDINGYCPHSFKKETICELNKKNFNNSISLIKQSIDQNVRYYFPTIVEEILIEIAKYEKKE